MCSDCRCALQVDDSPPSGRAGRRLYVPVQHSAVDVTFSTSGRSLE